MWKFNSHFSDEAITSSSLKTVVKFGTTCLFGHLRLPCMGVCESSNNHDGGKMLVDKKAFETNMSLKEELAKSISDYMKQKCDGEVPGSQMAAKSSRHSSPSTSLLETEKALMAVCQKRATVNGIHLHATSQLVELVKKIPKELYVSREAEAMVRSSAILASQWLSPESKQLSDEKTLTLIGIMKNPKVELAGGDMFVSLSEKEELQKQLALLSLQIDKSKRDLEAVQNAAYDLAILMNMKKDGSWNTALASSGTGLRGTCISRPK